MIAEAQQDTRFPARREVTISPFLSAKLRALMWLAVVAVVFVHAYNLGSRALVGENAADAPGTAGAAGFVEYLVSQALARWPAALFFAISGFLFFRTLAPGVEGYVQKWRRRGRTIVLPYLLWSAWGLLVYLLAHVLPSPGMYVNPGAIHTLDAATVVDLLFIHPVAYPLWFLQALAACLLLAPLIAWLIKVASWAALVPFAVLWFMDVDVGPGDYIQFKALLFFTLGALIATRLRRGTAVPTTGASGPATSAALGRWLLPLWVAACLVFAAALRGDDSWAAGLGHKLLMCLGVAALWFGYDAYLSGLVRRRWFAATAAFTFFVFAAHEPTLMVVKRLALHAGGGTDASEAVILGAYFIAPVVAIALCLSAGWVLRRWARPVYSALTGGR